MSVTVTPGGGPTLEWVAFAPVAKMRLDSLLADRGLFESRSRAAASVLAGVVRLGEDHHPAHKPGQLVEPDIPVAVDSPPPFVSRGGVKLANALRATGIDPAGRRALDVGVSTGGFTDCLLQEGAISVIAVDVGYGDLAWTLRNDARVIVFERTNARGLTPQRLPHRPDLAVLDVSFISLAKVLGPVLACLADRFDALALVKPQFEVGRGRVGRGGVVREPHLRREALVAVASFARRLGAEVMGFASSGLPGPKGNQESFVWLCEGGRAGAASSASAVELMARTIEP